MIRVIKHKGKEYYFGWHEELKDLFLLTEKKEGAYVEPKVCEMDWRDKWLE